MPKDTEKNRTKTLHPVVKLAICTSDIKRRLLNENGFIRKLLKGHLHGYRSELSPLGTVIVLPTILSNNQVEDAIHNLAKAGFDCHKIGINYMVSISDEDLDAFIRENPEFSDMDVGFTYPRSDKE